MTDGLEHCWDIVLPQHDDVAVNVDVTQDVLLIQDTAEGWTARARIRDVDLANGGRQAVGEASVTLSSPGCTLRQ